jgi:SagB-type dehydrogenase family enzyme
VVDAIFAGQPSLAAAPVLPVMAARLARSDWKYRHSHAYRVLLLDAGHLGQTFHLVCTAMGLAPFTLAGFQDSRLDACIGIDGVTEIPLYVAACGLPAP